MGDAQRMADFVCRQLADTGEGEFQRVRGRSGTGAIDAQKTFEDHPVLAHALAAQDDMTLDDFARARIDHRGAIGPAAGLAMHPLDDVVAHIERMHPFGQDLHAEGVFIAGRLERLGPPVSAFDQGIADERRRAAVEIIDDGLDHRAALGTGVNAFQPVPHGIAATHGFAERRGHVVEVDTETAGAFIGLADFIAI